MNRKLFTPQSKANETKPGKGARAEMCGGGPQSISLPILLQSLLAAPRSQVQEVRARSRVHDGTSLAWNNGISDWRERALVEETRRTCAKRTGRKGTLAKRRVVLSLVALVGFKHHTAHLPRFVAKDVA